MQLNDGRPNDLGEQQLFEVEIMTDEDVAAFPRGVQLQNQAIDTQVPIGHQQSLLEVADLDLRLNRHSAPS